MPLGIIGKGAVRLYTVMCILGGGDALGYNEERLTKSLFLHPAGLADSNRSDGMSADYPNPLAILVNPLAIGLLGAVIIASANGLVWIGKRMANKLHD